MKPVSTYVENGVTIKVYPSKTQKSTWMKNYHFYSALDRVDTSTGVFSAYRRKDGKA